MEEGKIIGLEGDDAILEIDRSQNCNGCKACCTLSREDSGLMVAKIPNDLHLNEGDRVKIEVSENQVLIANAIVFLLPVVFLIGGYMVGALILSPLLKTDQQWTGIILSAAGFLLSLYFVKITEDKQQKYFQPRMVKKLK